MKRTAIILAAATMLVALGAQAAPIAISVTGTAPINEAGFVAGQSYTFTATYNETASRNSDDKINYDSGHRYQYWGEEYTSDDSHVASVTGTGLSGAYVRPTNYDWSPYTCTKVYQWDVERPDLNFELWVGDDSGEVGMGLTAPNGSSSVTCIGYGIYTGNLPFTLSEQWVNASTYFSAYKGTYSVRPDEGYLRVYVNGWSDCLDFTPTSLRIAEAAVPEPATMGTLALGGIATLIRRRRRNTAA